jgi:hypothetical protein
LLHWPYASAYRAYLLDGIAGRTSTVVAVSRPPSRPNGYNSGYNNALRKPEIRIDSSLQRVMRLKRSLSG